MENRAQVKKQQQEILNEKISKMEQERSRLSQSWNNERQMSQVSVTYEAGTVVSDASYSEQVYNV